MGFLDNASAITHMLVVSDVNRSRDWYVEVLGASVYREYGGTSSLRANGAEFLTEPVEYPHEVRAFFRDPDGHLFEISEAR